MEGSNGMKTWAILTSSKPANKSESWEKVVDEKPATVEEMGPLQKVGYYSVIVPLNLLYGFAHH
jgi:hypothetical protein